LARKPDPANNERRILRAMGFSVYEGVPGAAGSLSQDPPTSESLRTPEQLDPAPISASLAGESLPISERIEQLDILAAEVAACQNCRLCQGRTNVVPGEGDPLAELAFVGEGPGRDEDEQGRPFVGRAGELLTKIIEAMKFRREEVWIGNVVKCRPPGNRPPEADEMEACLPYLQRQLAIIRPKIIVALGKTALTGLLPEHERTPMGRMRGQWLQWQGIPLMPTFHPAYLLRSPNQKRLVWDDMKLVMKEFGKTP
jgi:DNA polymerase